MFKVTIEGPPIPWKRVAKNKWGKAYDTQAAEKEGIGWQMYYARSDGHQYFPFSGPLKMTIYFGMEIPASFSEKKRKALHGTWHHKRPDGSNLLKLYEDAANGIIYNDDAQLCKFDIEKKWDLNPRTEITIEII